MTKQSIYQKVLGDQFEKLQPMLKKRYRLHAGQTFTAYGTMEKIQGGPRWLYPLWLLGTKFKLVFPERGEHIPFTIKNRAYITDKGVEEVHWERVFHFPKKVRYFNAVMSYDEKRSIIKDYLGEPAPIYSDLRLTVLADGSLEMKSVKQRLVLGKLEIPLPKFLHGIATVRESFNQIDGCYEIHVQVSNQIIGTVFTYKGVFPTGEYN